MLEQCYCLHALADSNLHITDMGEAAAVLLINCTVSVLSLVTHEHC